MAEGQGQGPSGHVGGGGAGAGGGVRLENEGEQPENLQTMRVFVGHWWRDAAGPARGLGWGNMRLESGRVGAFERTFGSPPPHPKEVIPLTEAQNGAQTGVGSGIPFTMTAIVNCC